MTCSRLNPCIYSGLCSGTECLRARPQFAKEIGCKSKQVALLAELWRGLSICQPTGMLWTHERRWGFLQMEDESHEERTSCTVCKDLAQPVDLSRNIRRLRADCISWLVAPAPSPNEAPVKMLEKGGLAGSLGHPGRGLPQGRSNTGVCLGSL